MSRHFTMTDDGERIPPRPGDPPCGEYDPAGPGAGTEEDGHPQCANCGHSCAVHERFAEMQRRYELGLQPCPKRCFECVDTHHWIDVSEAADDAHQECKHCDAARPYPDEDLADDLAVRLREQLGVAISLAMEATTAVREGRTEDALGWLDEIVEARRCQVCGCTERSACDPPCGWAGPALCTACAP